MLDKTAGCYQLPNMLSRTSMAMLVCVHALQSDFGPVAHLQDNGSILRYILRAVYFDFAEKGCDCAARQRDNWRVRGSERHAELSRQVRKRRDEMLRSASETSSRAQLPSRTPVNVMIAGRVTCR